MLSTTPHTTHQQSLQSPQINSQNNNADDYNVVTSGDNQVHVTQDTAAEEEEDAELDGLLDRYVSKDALHTSFYSPPESHPNTRTTVRNEIGKWIDNDRSGNSPLLWLNGPAGIGKSVIAKTISRLHNQVVATFFFSTSSDRTAATLFPTLAWQLARRIPDTRKHIIASLKNIGSLQTIQIEEQFDLLILRPLKYTMALEFRPVMVIDGVDECIDESMLVRFLRVLVRASEDIGIPVRFIICSRPEPRIRTILEMEHNRNPMTDEQEPTLEELKIRAEDGPLERILQSRSRTEHHIHTPIQWGRGFTKFLQDFRELYRPIRLGANTSSLFDPFDEPTDTLDKIYALPAISRIQIGLSEESKGDITRYLTDKFNAIRQPGDGSSPWFQPSDISDLVEASCGQFLYASTIARLLDEPHVDPSDVLEMARRSSLPTPDLNKLYKIILERALDTIRNQDHSSYQTELGFLMDSLAILVFFSENVRFLTLQKSFPVIESLLGLESGELTLKLRKLRPVLTIVPGESVRGYHRSFLEFLQSQKLSGKYHISYSTALRRVLILMGRAGLKYSIFQNNNTVGLCIQDMTVAYHGNFFGRSRFSNVLNLLHYLIHLLMRELLVLLFDTHITLAVSVPPVCRLILRFFLGFLGTFIISLKTYLIFVDLSINIPFFHPFLHPFFATGGFFVPSRLLAILLVFLTLILLV